MGTLTILARTAIPAPNCAGIPALRSIICLAARGARHFRRQPKSVASQRYISHLHPAASASTGATQQQQEQEQQVTRAEQQPPTPPAATMPFFLVEANGQGAPFHQASGPWLEAAPRGAYTTARTVGGDAVLELNFHIERLANTAKLMITADEESAALHSEAAAPAALPTAADPDLLRPRVLAAMRAAVQGYRSATGDAAGEVRLTVLVTWPGCQQPQPAHPAGASSSSSSSSSQSAALAPSAGADQPGVLVHVSSLPPRPAPPVRVVMRGAPRQNAEAKDSEWVRQRKCLQEGLPQPTEEVLLVGADGSIYEGLSSNFFALCADGKLHTAGDGILAGTVREVALAVARREGIPVVLQPPRLADLERWQGCFISSTSRLLLPVDEAGVFPEGGHEPGSADYAPVQLERVRRFERGGLVQRLEQLVLAELVACSEPLYS